MNLKHLEAFLAVIETGSIGGAAAKLGRPQPTLSHQLRALEDELGTALIERGVSGGPTLEGHTLVPIARRMLALASDARKAADLKMERYIELEELMAAAEAS